MSRRSITWPPELEAGRLPMTPDPEAPDALDEELDDELEQIIALSLLSYAGGIPFNRGLGMTDPTWGSQDRTTEGEIRGRIRERFATLQAGKRAKLVDVTFVRDPQAGVFTAAVEYVSLETSRKGRVERPIA